MEPMADASSTEQILMQRARDRRVPLNGSMELLPLCNMNCEMCYVRLSKQEMEKQGRMRTGEEWLALGKQMQEAGVMFLLLTGGEPLMHPDFKQIYLGLKKLGMILTLNTNGTLIDDEWADFFKENPPRRINITLYGAGRETYERLCHYGDGYERTLHGIELLKKRGVDIRLGVSVTNYNKQDLEKIFALRKKLDIFTIADTYMCSSTRERERSFAYEARCTPKEAAAYHILSSREMRGEEAFRTHVLRVVEQIDRNEPGSESDHMTCYAGRCSFAVNWQGKMNPCVSLARPAADVFELGFADAWQMITEEVDKIRISPKCAKCRYRSLCCNCVGNAFVETGCFDGTPDYLCRYTEEIYRLYKVEAERIRHEEII